MLYQIEARLRQERGILLIAGVDEAGRGPLAGPVVAAAVILDPEQPIVGLNDSKLLSEKRRVALLTEINKQALAVGVGICAPELIDRINILQATLLAMQRALGKLGRKAELVLIDGNQTLPGFCVPQLAIVKGDGKVAAIAAASIVAKVTRDRLMQQYERSYPQYGFAQHKGYPTPKHCLAIKEHGPSPIHRLTFNRVREYVADGP